MRKYWISWRNFDVDGSFTLSSPWWITGDGDEYVTICAAVTAEDEDAAEELIYAAYSKRPTYVDFRFTMERPADWSPFCERFPRGDWMEWS